MEKNVYKADGSLNVYIVQFFYCGAGYRNNGTAENSALCKTTLFFPDKYQNYTNDKMCIRKTESDFGKCCQANWTQKTNWLRSLLIDLNYVRNQLFTDRRIAL